jgi:hypothetical protein
VITNAFTHVLRKNRSCQNVPFSDFYRSLSTIESVPDANFDSNKANKANREIDDGGILKIYVFG